MNSFTMTCILFVWAKWIKNQFQFHLNRSPWVSCCHWFTVNVILQVIALTRELLVTAKQTEVPGLSTRVNTNIHPGKNYEKGSSQIEPVSVLFYIIEILWKTRDYSSWYKCICTP